VITRCGGVLRASSDPVDDLTVAGALWSTPSTYARYASDSPGRGEISCIAGTDAYSYYDDRALRSFGSSDLSPRPTATFPVDPAGPTPWRGRYVFYRSDGSERYVVLQLDGGTGAGGFGVATF
jgi:hypothetical protein